MSSPEIWNKFDKLQWIPRIVLAALKDETKIALIWNLINPCSSFLSTWLWTRHLNISFSYYLQFSPEELRLAVAPVSVSYFWESRPEYWPIHFHLPSLQLKLSKRFFSFFCLSSFFFFYQKKNKINWCPSSRFVHSHFSVAQPKLSSLIRLLLGQL